MKKIVWIAIVLSLVLVVSMLAIPAFAAPPPIQRQMEIVEATIEGGDIPTVDPAICYDTASGELLMNCYDTLVFFDGEHMDRYLPQLATEWTIENITGQTSPEGLPWYYRYTFKIRTGVPFQNPTFGNLTTADVEYTFERGMVIDVDGGPQWMFYEPLLNGGGHTFVNQKDVDPVHNATDAVLVGKMIDHAIESNSTHVWFNLAFPGAYAPFLQILSQTWSSIYSKAWANSLGRANWNGNWGDYKGWVAYTNPAAAPFDDPTPVQMGTGPWILANLDRTLGYWDANRFTNYWRGWPLNWPAFGGSKPAGYVNHFKVTWQFDWPARSTMFLNGDVDYCAVPRNFIASMLNQPNIRCTYPLPSLVVGNMMYMFDINPTTTYQTVYAAGVLGEGGVPRDFFGNATYGLAMRKAFAHCLDFKTYLQTAFLGEAIQPPTAMIPTLPYYNASIPAYNYDLALATTLFKSYPGLWDTGFTINLPYNTGNTARQIAMQMMATAINSLNPKFHASALSLAWSVILAAAAAHQLATFCVGWQADYPDPHNFAGPFYASTGTYAIWSVFSDATMDALVREGIMTSDPAPAGARSRATIYSDIQQRAIDLCPSLALYTGFGRHFELSWVCGWYYNPIYSGNYPANTWKWYYTPHAQQDSIGANTTGNLLPYDVNYDGKTNMVDIGVTAASFGAIYGPPMSSKWVYRADFNNDRKIDMKDIGGVAKNFGKTSAAWTPAT